MAPNRTKRTGKGKTKELGHRQSANATQTKRKMEAGEASRSPDQLTFFTATLRAPAFCKVFRSTSQRLASMSHASTCPCSPTKAATCVVLFPGAAHASNTCQPRYGASTEAVRQLAQLCRMARPPATAAWECSEVPGGKSSTWGRKGWSWRQKSGFSVH